jgi:hypothetical protein
MTKKLKISECPCAKCEFRNLTIDSEKCIKCSVINWSNFKQSNQKVELKTSDFSFSFDEKDIEKIQKKEKKK